MNFIELAEKRQSVRAYSNKAVEKDKIDRCIEAARLAPSACNAQPWHFIVVDDPVLKSQIARYTSNKLLPLNHFTNQAPVHVVVVREKPNFTSKAGQVIRNKKFTVMDIAIASEHFCLQATSEGLGTCMLGWFNEPKVKELLNIPKQKRAELVITLGYPADDTTRYKRRKETKQIRSYNSYQ